MTQAPGRATHPVAKFPELFAFNDSFSRTSRLVASRGCRARHALVRNAES
jgi:hypothetical protein